jgi:hypothetical protein
MAETQVQTQPTVYGDSHTKSERNAFPVGAIIFSAIISLVVTRKPGTDHGFHISTLDWQLKLIVVGCLFPRSSGLAGPGTAADHRGDLPLETLAAGENRGKQEGKTGTDHVYC